MKIAIVTPYDSANCGAYLQAYANKCFLEKNNHNVCFVQWRNRKQRKKEYFSKPNTIKELIRYGDTLGLVKRTSMKVYFE